MSNNDTREQKNAALFAAQGGPPQGVPGGVQSVAIADRLKADFGLEIPVESVPLPSLGKVYPNDSALQGRETVEITAMTAREEDILTSKALLKKGTVITELIRSCLIDKSINPIDMLTGDRNALMVAIRITGYGQGYDADVTCSECEHKFTETFDLAAMPIKRLEIEPTSPGQNVFEFVLPRTKKRVLFRFMTGRVEQEISMQEQKQKKIGMPSDNAITTGLHHSIIAIDGIDDRAKIAQFVRFMPASDSRDLRTYINTNQPDIVMKQTVTCPACNHEEEVDMPMGMNFLWPETRG